MHRCSPLQDLPRALTCGNTGSQGPESKNMADATQDTYTPEQRETLESGLRILARMIARAQLRREAGPSSKENTSAG